MNFRDFRIGWRLLIQEPIHSAVVVIGLAVGFSVCFLLLGFVRHSLSYDAQIKDSAHIYVVKTQYNQNGPGGPWGQLSSPTYRDVLAASGLKVEASGFNTFLVSMKIDQVPMEVGLTLVHTEFPDMFGVVALEGDLSAALTRPDALALTVDTAHRLFGEIHVVGKTIQINGKVFQIVALLPDPPTTTTFPYAALAGVNSGAIPDATRDQVFTDSGVLHGNVFVKLEPGVSTATVTQVLQDAADRSPMNRLMTSPELSAKLGSSKLMEIRLGRLRDAYLDPDITPNDNGTNHGDVRLLSALAALAVLILLLAITNYVNLATVRTLRRQKEIAVRKVMGASVGHVVRQFIAESLLVSFMATGLGLLLAYALLPVFAELMNRHLDDIFTPAALLVSALLGIVLGLISGAYPTWVALRVRATEALAGRGNSETSTGMWMRRVLTVLQFTAAMLLCAVSTAIAWQTEYATTIDPGFDPKPLLIIDLPSTIKDPNSKAFRDAAARLPGVGGVTVAMDAIGRRKQYVSNRIKRAGGEGQSMELKLVQPDFFEVYGIAPKAGRLFSSKIDNDDTDGVVINSAAALAMGFPSAEAAVGQAIIQEGSETPLIVVGIAPDVRFASLRESPKPLCYVVNSDYVKTMTVRANQDVNQVRDELEQTWKIYFPNNVLHITPAKTFFEMEYGDDLRVAKMLSASTLIVILIAAFGIYVLAAYSVQRRSQEIVLRKLHGANRRAIAGIVGREFIMLVVISAAIAMPISALAIERYLAGFAERAPFGIWPLMIGFWAAAFVALLSTLRHTIEAMRIAPIEILRQ